MKKLYIIFLTVIIIFGTIIFIFFGIPELKKREALKKSTNIIIGYDTFWSYDSENKWRVMNKEITYGNKKYNVYVNSEYKGKYDVDLVNDKWYYFNETKEENYQGELFAHNGKRNIKLINYNSEQITINDLKYIKDIINDVDISLIDLNDLTINQKVSIDIDNDLKQEYIYSISNFGCDECNNSQYFSVVFLIDNGKITKLNSSYHDSDYYEIPLYKLAYIIDLDNNNNYELIISRSTAGNNKLYHELFIIDKKKYKKVISSGG